MSLVRRLYLYLIAAVSLTALAIGLTNLLELLLGTLRAALGGPELLAGDGDAVRRQLSIYAALTIVALPIWMLHWWMAERSLRSDDGEQERRSAIRALFLTAVLGGSLLAGAIAFNSLARHAVLALAGSPRDGDVESGFALLLVAGGIWAFHGLARLRDMRGGQIDGPADWLPRLYVYGAAFVGVTLVAFALGDLLALLVEVLLPSDDLFAGDHVWDGLLASGVARVLTGTAIWAGHWLLSLRLVQADDWRGQHARASALRRLYGYSVAFGAALITLLLVTRVGEAVLANVLTVADSADASFARQLLDPALRLAPFIVAWVYHRQLMLEESRAQVEVGQQATARRLYSYAIALIGIALMSFGLANLLAIGIDRVGNADTIVFSGGDPWRTAVARLVPLTLVGLAAWLWHWTQVQRWLADDPVAERAATVRRGYLLAVIAGSIIALLISLAIVIYRLFAELLGVADVGLVDELGRPVAVLLVAGSLLAYHALLLRADLGERTDDRHQRTITLVITAPAGADAGSLSTAIEPHLPPGYTIHSTTVRE